MMNPSDTQPSDVTARNVEHGLLPPPLMVQSGRLSNGMQVVVIPDRRAPVVTHMVWYRNGSSDDPAGKSGIAHFLEHLMFKGTDRYPAGHFTKLIAAEGGQENAFTAYDYTCYYQQVLRHHLPTCMAYEADRMCNLAFDETVVAPERNVVLEERAMRYETRPEALLKEEVTAAAIPAHPSGRPIIGWRHEIERLTRADALAYYRRFYRPGNAILVVAGDAKPAVVLALAEEAYGRIPSGEGVRERHHVQDPPTRTHRQVTLRDGRVRQPQLQRLHIVPAPGIALPGESEALSVLALLLGGNRTAVLHQRLVVTEKLATSIGVEYEDYFTEQARFSINAVPAEGVSPQVLDAAVEDELRTVLAVGFPAGAIERAKTRLVADALYTQDNQFALANWYGQSLTLGFSLDDLATWQARIEAVTPEAIRDALALLVRGDGVSGYLLGLKVA
ncbi:M16 family metallopeptidase [Methylobacterium bullatum]|uniref:Putative zinc protease n=1 Tax=Methylobacterium bullatum TaxID=570505 RepID=A0A679K0B9_9HYPH|nr:putative zinc protease [Methylobacterium bullatum]